MTSNPPKVLLSEIVTIKGGKRLPAGKSLQSLPSEHPYIRVRDVGQRNLPREGIEYVPDDVFPSISRYIVQENDVVLSIVGTIGALSIVDNFYDYASLTENCVKLTGLDYHDALYLYYYLSSSVGQQEIFQGTVGAVQPKLPIYNIEKIKVLWLYDKDKRKDIASVLGKLDDKIDLNRRINQTLEAMAQAIFKSWFVDFDPVKAKIAAIAQGQDPLRAAIRAISGKTDAELDQMPREHHDQLAATAALFPDAMEESEFGEIPKGWNSVPFGCLLSHTIGGDWGTEAPDTVNDTRVAIIRGTDIPDLDQAQLSRVPIRYTNKKKLATRRLQVGDIVLEVSGGSKDQPTGRSFHMTANALRAFDCPVEPASFCRLLRPVSLEVSVVLSLHLSCIYQQGKTWEYQNQSTGIANFQTSHFLEAELVVVPPNPVLEVFFGMISPILERRHDAQGRKLALTRDTLLPKLMSGELPVSCQLNKDAQ
ncbi:restriction endonuclease subunit S [Bordetella bronchiseptica]|uniref:restriction endonuclease subunit S n=1 Tax=Bordetella bronchiseptica TaxID=518 RepID=UPI00187D4A30|nr:restriction endonuclease subunit S [Bordetella bronchiseptica]